MRTATSRVTFFIVPFSSFDLARACAHAGFTTLAGGGEGGIRTLEAGISRLRDFQSRSFGQLGHLSVRTSCSEYHGGEGGIRTLGTVLSVQPLSRRLPSALLGHLSRSIGDIPARGDTPDAAPEKREGVSSASGEERPRPPWRREQDSNLRGVAAQRFSRPPPSAARPSLHEAFIYTRLHPPRGGKNDPSVFPGSGHGYLPDEWRILRRAFSQT